jgi:hypothetical protein
MRNNRHKLGGFMCCTQESRAFSSEVRSVVFSNVLFSIPFICHGIQECFMHVRSARSVAT